LFNVVVIGFDLSSILGTSEKKLELSCLCNE
jgi:hypothetical protein